MAARETPPVSERSTELSSSSDIKRRLLFLLAAVGGPAGVILVLYGLSQGRIGFAIGGGALAAVALLTWLRRHSWGGDATVREIKENPFKVRREPEE